MRAIYAFNHQHEVGDVCDRAHCEAVRRAPTLRGTEVVRDMSMRILRKATPEEYLRQEIPAGSIIPPLVYGCRHIYEVEVLE